MQGWHYPEKMMSRVLGSKKVAVQDVPTGPASLAIWLPTLSFSALGGYLPPGHISSYFLYWVCYNWGLLHLYVFTPSLYDIVVLSKRKHLYLSLWVYRWWWRRTGFQVKVIVSTTDFELKCVYIQIGLTM